MLLSVLFFFSLYCDHRDLPALTPAFPARRSSDLPVRPDCPSPAPRPRRRCGRAPVPVRATSRRWRRSLRPQRMPSIRLPRSEEHTSELQSLMRISYAVFCLKKKNKLYQNIYYSHLTQSDKRIYEAMMIMEH